LKKAMPDRLTISGIVIAYCWIIILSYRLEVTFLIFNTGSMSNKLDKGKNMIRIKIRVDHVFAALTNH